MQFLFENGGEDCADGGNKEFQFPTNVKQMGCIEDEIKIYMEDYVYTYLHQYAKSIGGQEKIAALVGKNMTLDGKSVVVISGAIQGKGTKSIKGMESFTDETWEYISDQMDTYFKDLEIVGWMHTQPGFGAFLMGRDEIFHRENFKEKWNVLFVIDPIEKVDTFYVYDESNKIKSAKGYFIYFDNKNSNMQEYMLSSQKRTMDIQEVDIFEKNEQTEQKNQRTDAASKIRKVMNKKTTPQEKSKPEKIKVEKAKPENETTHEPPKARVAMLTGVCAVLCIASASMGASLLSSQTRLNKLETELSSVRTSYVALSQQMTTGSLQPVFASQNQDAQQQLQSSDQSTLIEEFTLGITQKSQPQQTTIAEEIQKVQEVEAVEEEVVEEVAEKEYAKYTIQSGDNLGSISNDHYGDGSMVASIMEINNIDDANKIFAGQVIKLP